MCFYLVILLRVCLFLQKKVWLPLTSDQSDAVRGFCCLFFLDESDTVRPNKSDSVRGVEQVLPALTAIKSSTTSHVWDQILFVFQKIKQIKKIIYSMNNKTKSYVLFKVLFTKYLKICISPSYIFASEDIKALYHLNHDNKTITRSYS